MNFEIAQLSSEKQLEPILRLLNKNFHFDSLPLPLLKEKTFEDPDFDPELALIACIDGTPIGFFLGIRRNDRCFIKLFAVDKKWREQGIGSALLAEIESRAKMRGCKVIRVLEGAPNYFQPGLDPRYTAAFSFLAKRGYKVFDTVVNMTVELKFVEIDRASEGRLRSKLGIEFRRASHEDRKATLIFIKEVFPAWEGEVKEAFKQFRPTIHIAVLDRKVVGFSAYETNNKGTGWFGPMGVSPEIRGHGIGRLLLLRCLSDMRAMGFERAIIPWVGPIRFYFKAVGAAVDRIFWRMEKAIG